MMVVLEYAVFGEVRACLRVCVCVYATPGQRVGSLK